MPDTNRAVWPWNRSPGVSAGTEVLLEDADRVDDLAREAIGHAPGYAWARLPVGVESKKLGAQHPHQIAAARKLRSGSRRGAGRHQVGPHEPRLFPGGALSVLAQL